VERFPPVVFLRNTALTTADAAIRALGDEAAADADSDRLALLHRLMDAIRERMRFDTDGTDPRTSAPDAFALGHGVCQDFAHIFIAAARHLGIPARYVGGYIYRVDEVNDQEAGHAWAEALVDDLGWVGFDPANGISPTDAHIRVAVGLDYLGAAPVRGTRYGGHNEALNVKVQLRPGGKSSGSGRPRRCGAPSGPTRRGGRPRNFVRFIAVSTVYTGTTGPESVAGAEP
jgi:transglutaminase-like putative cysteine protease